VPTVSAGWASDKSGTCGPSVEGALEGEVAPDDPEEVELPLPPCGATSICTQEHTNAAPRW
jgi:hypothetical protein